MGSADSGEENLAWWGDCKLGRKRQADLLTKYLLERNRRDRQIGRPNTYSLNIDAPWGMGKTFFIERWMQDLQVEGLDHPVLIFNAWENDYSKDALGCLLGSILDQLDKYIKKNEDGGGLNIKERLETLRKAGTGLVKVLAPAAVGVATTALIGVPIATSIVSDPSSSMIDDMILDRISKLSSDTAKEAIESKEGQADIVEHFRTALRLLINEVEKIEGKSLPVFLFVDDLDRCRPDFTIELLECIKHFLSVDGVYFVFATDAEQLNASLNAVYGSKFQGERFFKRIFNREVRLAEPDHDLFAAHLFSPEAGYIQIGEVDFFVGETDPLARLKLVFSGLSRAYDLDLRVQIACVEQLDMVLQADLPNCLIEALVHLVILWNIDKTLCEKQADTTKLLEEHLKKLAYFDTRKRDRTIIGLAVRNALGRLYRLNKTNEPPRSQAYDGLTIYEVGMLEKAHQIFMKNPVFNGVVDFKLDFSELLEPIRLTSS